MRHAAAVLALALVLAAGQAASQWLAAVEGVPRAVWLAPQGLPGTIAGLPGC
ncbi:MAG: hypothetical protein AB1430_16825 [Pseudomonadota bacterium]